MFGKDYIFWYELTVAQHQDLVINIFFVKEYIKNFDFVFNFSHFNNQRKFIYKENLIYTEVEENFIRKTRWQKKRYFLIFPYQKYSIKIKKKMIYLKLMALSNLVSKTLLFFNNFNRIWFSGTFFRLFSNFKQKRTKKKRTFRKKK